MTEDMNGPDTPNTIDELLRASRSSDWSAREEACVAMSPHTSDPTIATRLTEMLHDSDIAIQVAATEVLVRRGGVDGLTAVLEEIGRRIDDPDADHIAYKLQELQGLDELPILQQARVLVGTNPTEAMRVGASEIEKLFGHYSQ